MSLWIFTVTLTFKKPSNFYNKNPIQLIMMCYPIRWDCKKISRLVDWVETVIFDYMNSKCDLDLEDSKPIFLHDTLAHDDASPYQVWLQKVLAVDEISSRSTVTGILNLFCDLDFNQNRAQSNLFTKQSSLWWCVIKLWLQKNQQFRRYIRNSYFVYVILYCDLTSKTANWSFWKTIWPIKMHNHIKFGSKSLSGSEVIIWTNTHWHFEIMQWPDLQQKAALASLKPVWNDRSVSLSSKIGTDALPCHIDLPVCLWIMDPHSRAPKKNTSHGNKMSPQDTTHLIQRPCYRRGSQYQNLADTWTTRRPHDYRKEMQTAVVWTCLLFIRSGQNHLARYSEKGKKTRQTEEDVGWQHQKMDRPGVCQVPEGSGEQGKTEETVCEIICGAPTTLVVKGSMMMMMMMTLNTAIQFLHNNVLTNNVW